LEEQTGNKLDEERLRAVCEEVKKQDEYIAELYDLRKAIPNPFPGIFHLMLFSERFVGTGTPEGTEMLKAMYEVTKERYKKGQGVLPEERVRLGLAYLGHYTTGGEFWKWMENNGISPIIEMLSMFNHQHYRMDCSTVDTMLDRLADQSSNTPMTKQIRGPYDYQGQWLDDVVTVFNDYKADCAVYLGTMGCKNTWGCVKVLMRRIEEDLGIPTLIIQSDAWDDRVTPWPVIKDQIEEFVNTVVL
jgi:benzoyl-CoA reductase/2-hydroxyglutaryl-CoA dehydratase subunit BcrC/BadD/HgdB